MHSLYIYIYVFRKCITISYVMSYEKVWTAILHAVTRTSWDSWARVVHKFQVIRFQKRISSFFKNQLSVSLKGDSELHPLSYARSSCNSFKYIYVAYIVFFFFPLYPLIRCCVIAWAWVMCLLVAAVKVWILKV